MDYLFGDLLCFCGYYPSPYLSSTIESSRLYITWLRDYIILVLVHAGTDTAAVRVLVQLYSYQVPLYEVYLMLHTSILQNCAKTCLFWDFAPFATCYLCTGQRCQEYVEASRGGKPKTKTGWRGVILARKNCRFPQKTGVLRRFKFEYNQVCVIT